MKFVRRHKKMIIILSVLLALLITVVILMFTLFSLKNVELNFKTETLNVTEEMKDEIQAEVLKTGGSVLFVGKEKIIKDLEKKFPYIKIVNIETQIPNKFVIHCLEREELFAVQSQGKTYFLDEEFKILRIESSSYESQEGMPVVLEFENLMYDESDPTTIKPYTLELNLGASEEGQFLTLKSSSEAGAYFAEKLESISKSILTSFEENNRGIADVRSMYKKFKIFYYEEVVETSSYWHLCLRLVGKDGYVCEIRDADNHLPEKFQIMFQAFSEVQKENLTYLNNSKLIVYKNGSNYKYYFEKITEGT